MPTVTEVPGPPISRRSSRSSRRRGRAATSRSSPRRIVLDRRAPRRRGRPARRLARARRRDRQRQRRDRRRAARLHAPSASTTCPALLERGRAARGRRGLDVEFVEGDAEALPFPDASFDAVTSIFGAMFAPDHPQAAAELAARLPPGRHDRARAAGRPTGSSASCSRRSRRTSRRRPASSRRCSGAPRRTCAGCSATRSPRSASQERTSSRSGSVGRGVRRAVPPLVRPDAEGVRGARDRRGPRGPGGRHRRARAALGPPRVRRRGRHPGGLPRDGRGHALIRCRGAVRPGGPSQFIPRG